MHLPCSQAGNSILILTRRSQMPLARRRRPVKAPHSLDFAQNAALSDESRYSGISGGS